MDFSEAVSQHQAWKQRLRRILLGRERRRQPERTAAIRAGQCPLDGWLKANRTRLVQDPLFEEVEEHHRRTHALAIRMVLEEAPAEDSMAAVYRIGQFQICSRNLLEALEKLRQKHGLSEVPLCSIPPGFPREEFHPGPVVPG